MSPSKILASVLVLGAVVTASPAARATTFESETTYFTRLHFDRTAFGKPVASVAAHVGVLTRAAESRGGAEYWQDARDVPLALVGDAFVGRATLRGASAYESAYVRGEVVQYWVTFEDGSRMITDTSAIPETAAPESVDADGRTEGAARKTLQDELEGDEAIDGTWSKSIRFVHVG